VVNQITEDKKNGIASDTDAYFITIASYRLALCLQELEGQPFSTITKDKYASSTGTDNYLLARQKPMTSWSTAKLSAFLDAFQVFERKLVQLTSEVQTPNFWKASA
jgi:hypothetical protein